MHIFMSEDVVSEIFDCVSTFYNILRENIPREYYKINISVFPEELRVYFWMYGKDYKRYKSIESFRSFIPIYETLVFEEPLEDAFVKYMYLSFDIPILSLTINYENTCSIESRFIHVPDFGNYDERKFYEFFIKFIYSSISVSYEEESVEYLLNNEQVFDEFRLSIAHRKLVECAVMSKQKEIIDQLAFLYGGVFIRNGKNIEKDIEEEYYLLLRHYGIKVPFNIYLTAQFSIK